MKKSMLGIDIGTGSIKLVTKDQCERTWHP